MFTDEFLEEILTDKEVMKIPNDYKYTIIRLIERKLEERGEENATIRES